MDHDNSTRHILQGRELIDYLVEKASGATNAELLVREERRNRRMAALLSVLTFFGIGAIVGAIKMFVQNEIEVSEVRVREEVTEALTLEFVQRHDEFQQSVAASIAERVDNEVGAVRAELQNYKLYQELIAHSEGVATNAADGKIAEKSLGHAMDAIAALADVPTIRGQPRFLEAVNVVVDVLVRTDRESAIEKFETLLGDVMATHKDTALDLVDHYGELIISSPYPIERLTTEAAALARYAAAAREHSYPERALMWELFVAYKSNGYSPNRTTESLVEMTHDLSDTDLNELCYQLFLHSHPLHWMNTPDHEGREMARLVNGLMNDHPTLRKILEARAEDPQLATRLAGLVQRRRERSGETTPSETPPAEPAESPTEVAEAPPGPNNTLRR
ncbi:hypothetical protein Pla108_36110 [Botrimarina colliarenosi]|uniref:Uncharacterized protein n=2 Tax=Botrimarina colliarenosi TaxID=2528001 RepID=A0A5C6A4A5_9BACT|nr:hypothetical protein Pla108_36110 [Botrimarina colliarenosi]